MRSLRLARVAAQAELLRLRLLVRRQGVRAVLGAAALVFLLACLADLHVAGYVALRRSFDALDAVLIVAATDLAIGILFGLLALRDSPGAAEREALQVRRTAQQELAEAVALTALAGPVLRAAGTRNVYGLVLAMLAVQYFRGRR